MGFRNELLQQLALLILAPLAYTVQAQMAFPLYSELLVRESLRFVAIWPVLLLFRQVLSAYRGSSSPHKGLHQDDTASARRNWAISWLGAWIVCSTIALSRLGSWLQSFDLPVGLALAVLPAVGTLVLLSTLIPPLSGPNEPYKLWLSPALWCLPELYLQRRLPARSERVTAAAMALAMRITTVLLMQPLWFRLRLDEWLPPHRRSFAWTRTNSTKRISHMLRLGFELVVIFLAAHEIWYYKPNESSGHRILSSLSSTTGRIVVGEQAIHDTSFRYLRADHSLLGGLWVDHARTALAATRRVPKTSISEWEAVQEADTIFDNFILLEISRLARPLPIHPEMEKVLTIGLGIGLATRSAHEFGFNVTAVEIDPAVIEAARKYFGCPALKGGYVAQDASKYLIDAPPNLIFDAVIHDVFTGGLVEPSLVSTDFLELVKSHLSSTGMLALNYVGHPSDRSWQAVASSLRHSFAHVRAFRERRPPSARTPDAVDDSPANHVFVASEAVVSFRPPHPMDMLERPAPQRRRAVFDSFLSHEVDLSAFEGRRLGRKEIKGMRTDAVKNARRVWHAMKEILPASSWAEYEK